MNQPLPRSYALSPETPRWVPRTWAHVVSAAANGLLDESRWVELKEAIPAGNARHNIEVAKDLASLGAEGGLLIVGIKDNNGRAGDVVGTAGLTDLRGRLDQIARTRIQPPLHITSASLPGPDNSSDDQGCLLVHVPRSPNAPHMVDGNYWGRGDTGKHKLSDAEVRRYFNERRLPRELAAPLLHKWIENPALWQNATEAGRLYVIAAPVAGRPEQFRDVLYQRKGPLPQAMQRVAKTFSARSFHPGTQLISHAGHNGRGNRSDRYSSQPEDRNGVNENSLIVVDVHEADGVRTMLGRVTDLNRGARYVMITAVHEWVEQTLRLAAELGNQVAYYGPWDVGVHISKLRDAADSVGGELGQGRGRWSEDTYEDIRTVSTDELSDSPQRVTYDLMVNLARGLRVEQRLARELDQAVSE